MLRGPDRPWSLRAHQRIVHRDLKPENFARDADERIPNPDSVSQAPDEERSDSQTTPPPAGTEPASSWGTAGYMSPGRSAGSADAPRTSSHSALCCTRCSGNRAFRGNIRTRRDHLKLTLRASRSQAAISCRSTHRAALSREKSRCGFINGRSRFALTEAVSFRRH